MKTFTEYTNKINEMVAGDSGGDPQKIAAGETSGAVTSPGPKTLGKKKREEKSE